MPPPTLTQHDAAIHWRAVTRPLAAIRRLDVAIFARGVVLPMGIRRAARRIRSINCSTVSRATFRRDDDAGVED